MTALYGSDIWAAVLAPFAAGLGMLGFIVAVIVGLAALSEYGDAV